MTIDGQSGHDDQVDLVGKFIETGTCGLEHAPRMGGQIGIGRVERPPHGPIRPKHGQPHGCSTRPDKTMGTWFPRHPQMRGNGAWLAGCHQGQQAVGDALFIVGVHALAGPPAEYLLAQLGLH